MDFLQECAVLIAAYNAEKTLRRAVESALASDFPVQVFIVDDGSDVPASQCLGDLASRVEIIRFSENAGPAVARNEALQVINSRYYRYVAILDADDVMHSSRIRKQIRFLEQNPKVGVVGTWKRCFDEHTGDTKFFVELPEKDSAIRRKMFFNVGISHATAMFRMDALRDCGIYGSKYRAAEDYELMRRVGTKYQFANVPEHLMHYQISSRGQSQTLRGRQLFLGGIDSDMHPFWRAGPTARTLQRA
jgi:glycosyltransferase involved in cell wall biosynthesis